MSEYATLKRRPILFPDSVSSFHDSIFSLKEELKALVADDLQNKDAYVQTAVEIARAADTKPLSMAFNEVARGEVSYDPESIDVKNH